jgi:cell fate regulator YaaT (PSP1 superfamily)
MPTVIPVKFKFATHDLWFDPADTGVVAADHVICTTERGQEIGLATDDPREVDDAELKRTTNGVPLRSVDRVATEEDLAHAEELADKGDEGMAAFRKLVDDTHLDMKPVGVEYLFGGGKVICYFAAEERVDFRQLVRDLSRELHERVDMRQIGVREEAGLMGGFGHCGQELCCSRFGCGFDPVSIRMAKEQDLPLNSNKISGACGRLMCCLRYEFEAYRDFKGRAPKKNAVIETPLGKAKIIEYDTPKEQLALRLENGKQVRIPLASMEASEAAHKKSEDLGCPCRPDTVTREALDALESPDIAMALADLDRANGIIPAETFDDSDIFVERKRPRRHNGGGNGGNGGGNGSGGNGRRGNGRRNPDSNGEGAAPEGAKRRRRRSAKPAEGSAEQGAKQSQNQSNPTGEQHTRRRHHSSTGEGSGQGAQNQQGSGQRRTRKPGDKGGAQANGGGQAGGNASAKDGAQQTGDAPKRKRRHRGGRGRGKGTGGEGGSNAGSNGASDGGSGNGGSPSSGE